MTNAENIGLVKNFSAMHKLLHEYEGQFFFPIFFVSVFKEFYRRNTYYWKITAFWGYILSFYWHWTTSCSLSILTETIGITHEVKRSWLKNIKLWLVKMERKYEYHFYDFLLFEFHYYILNITFAEGA